MYSQILILHKTAKNDGLKSQKYEKPSKYTHNLENLALQSEMC